MKRERAGGINAVESVLRNVPERVTQLWIGGHGKRLDELARLAEDNGIRIQRAQQAALDKLAGDTDHQGVVAEMQPAEPLVEADLDRLVEQAGSACLLLVLDQVQDPHNLGACMRSAAAAGATALVVPRDRAVGMTPAVRRAAAGAAEIVPLVQVPNLARALERVARAGVWCTGLAGDGSQSLHEVSLTGPAALVLGGEESGLRQLTRKRCDVLARIPMADAVESLNVSVAAGIALFEARRQRALA